ncbi:MAG: KamA family radical SAM protein [Syntrophobacteraceae bacterium]
MISFSEFAAKWALDACRLEEIDRWQPFRCSRYFADLVRHPDDPIWRQIVPDTPELQDGSGMEDPLSEERLSPVPNLVHRYPNRVLWLVHDKCALHCRFCTRKRKWRAGGSQEIAKDLAPALQYIRENRQIQDVLLSGGDPLLLPLTRIREILEKLREIKHVQIIRIGTRVPCALPDLVTPELAGLLRKFHPLYLNIHFNHPAELTSRTERACSILADAGIPLGSQTVLLRGINDNHEALGDLFHRLLSMRVRPYYLMQMDLTGGTAHFRTPVACGLKIIEHLRNRISGLAMPHFVIDMPGGHGKVALTPKTIREIGQGRMIVENYLGKLCAYPLLDGEESELSTLIGK